MQRSEFLAQPDVHDFIEWLVVHLPQVPVTLSFAKSQFVPGGLQRQVQGLEAVLANYCWKAQWVEPGSGQVVESRGWADTRASLQRLRQGLLAALQSNDEARTFDYCLAVLKWGGVRGAIVFLRELMMRGRLVAYLKACQPLFALEGQQALGDLNERSIQRFDAGLTKIHALLDDSGSPIYDSRVGAAIAMLYGQYRQQAGARAVLNFPSGGARGRQIRNPGALGFASAPQFFTRGVSRQAWAQAQVQLGWIIRATLERGPLFAPGTIAERAHAFEAALFMLGYDLRALQNVAVPRDRAPAQAAPSTAAVDKSFGWVPSSHPFSAVLKDYLSYRLEGDDVSSAGFKRWLVAAGRTSNTANSYCFPIRANEFDLAACSLDSLRRIVAGGEAGLREVNGGQEHFMFGDEREQVCLVNAWLAGRGPYLAARSDLDIKGWLMAVGYAGTPLSAGVVLSVGRAVGRHFGLLDAADQPTALFERFYGQTLKDLEVIEVAEPA